MLVMLAALAGGAAVGGRWGTRLGANEVLLCTGAAMTASLRWWRWACAWCRGPLLCAAASEPAVAPAGMARVAR